MNGLFFLLDMPAGRIIDFDLATVISTLANLVPLLILGLILTKVMYAPVRKFLNDRTERVRSQLDEAREGRAAAGELRSRYDRQLKEIDLERAAILDEARKHANDQRENILASAKDEAKDIKERAGMEVEMERERIREEIHSALIDISSDMAEKLLMATIDRGAHDRLFDEGLMELDRVVFDG
ncbi:MAG: F0F1 ATP synthase subunit B [Defluviitaleaceae bacterium]|nr:F0F1 ATP synthase subunit B [Defluviitaleaceae bacterium]